MDNHLCMNSAATLHASCSRVSLEVGPWLIGRFFRPSNSYKAPVVPEHGAIRGSVQCLTKRRKVQRHNAREKCMKEGTSLLEMALQLVGLSMYIQH